MRNFTIGCDPEIFLVESGPIRSGFSAVGVCPGTKAAPWGVNGGAVQVDGMALEVNVHPSRTRGEFKTNITNVLTDLKTFVPEGVMLDMGNPYMEFDPAYLAIQPPEAIELGCEPDYNGWTGDVNPRPNATVNFRTAAGHIHIGWEANEKDPYGNKEHFQLCCDMAKQMDYYVGIYSLLWDPDNRRRALYGGAGAFRAKSYGFEYRTPSTAWLASEELQDFVFDASMKAVIDFFDGDRPADIFGDEARKIIDENRVDWQSMIDFDLGVSLPYQKAA